MQQEPRIIASSELNYDTYLRIDDLVSLQTPLSNPQEHDEMLFIVIHQSYELWFRLMIYEMGPLNVALAEGNWNKSLAKIRRMRTIFKSLVQQVDILETMTPNDFNRFRERLAPASGFQSYQFRVLEFKLGAKDERFLKFHQHNAEHLDALRTALEEPSAYDALVDGLVAKGLFTAEDLAKAVVDGKKSQFLAEFFANLYRNSESNFDLYMLLESLMDLDEGFAEWRYRHVVMVSRMIGAKTGTGGSSGASYLQTTLSKRFFPELWESRSLMQNGQYS